MSSKTLSIIIPCYNEQDHILEILNKIESVTLIYDIQKEIIIIDDFSTDNTRSILQNLESAYQIHYQDKNYGKWYAVRTWIQYATWDYLIIQDADLEYDPSDYTILLKKLIDEDLPVIYGSRRMNKTNKQYSGWIYYIGWNITTIIMNLLYGTQLTDGNTCYKMFRKQAIQDMKFTSQKFDFDQEITSKFLKKYKFITEIPIHYYPRNNDDGKKISLFDFFHALDVILKFRMWVEKEKRTLWKIIMLGIWGVLVFWITLWILSWLWIYQQHNYYSIWIALFLADLMIYRCIKLLFFWHNTIPIKSIIKQYLVHTLMIIWVYFWWVFYFVKIAQGEGLYQWLFFVIMSIFIVSWGNFLTNLIQWLREME